MKILLALAASVAVIVVGQRHYAGQKDARSADDRVEPENEALFI